MARRPSWYRDGKVVVSSAPTCGINKAGIDRFVVDDPKQVGIKDQLYSDVLSIRQGKATPTTQTVNLKDVLDPWRAVPTHFDMSSVKAFRKTRSLLWPEWSEMSLGQLIDQGWVIRKFGHGSPSKDSREGTVPYIKVSDLRAGLVNINPTNMVSETIARSLWKGKGSGLEPFDLISPERASANIGEFCVLMPGQERVVLTREVIIFRATPLAPFDAFFLLWALSLKAVRAQWRRLIFMQTNREDVGDRYREILVPIPPDKKQAYAVATEFRAYFMGMSMLRANFAQYLYTEGLHHFTLTGAIEADEQIGRDDPLRIDADTDDALRALLRTPKPS